ncbi:MULTISPECIES: cupin domain-containing protein [unclassified Undibacterium]|uniref:cupin domain-containing protein n=1 Tax=unclassified Undibacterium TaxID=2630295 RepID=UPI002AC97E0D|nr:MULTISPECIES: cupin domain-containing protein [unclassified Undibacterium]MEB0139148.1 cupin domain-containing protein [Undibacterium sp. CCC2.1]MEB0172872.1 cupin domain-containing protein [Undibacterium sp. CCC1.1]MEB0176656.1 cupin domain-containing protein [Undibacterium sp. CCC3.4]MEB0216016.1 cupin domain-containing protein [Undibacterium sp. 5I2]WPX43142.1 cupin domain-containing protein [Undibacterium sp. CCC3.4]
MKNKILALACGVALSLAGVTALIAYQAGRHVAATPAASQAAAPLSLLPFAVNPNWVLAGTPNFRAAEFFQSSDGKTRSGIFECDAAKFEWHYQFDEAIYILDGSVEIDYLGHHFHLKAGDSALFRAGTTAIWEVPTHLKKSWTIHDAGAPARSLARLMQR